MKRFVPWIAPLLLFIGSARAACTDSGAVASTRAAAELQGRRSRALPTSDAILADLQEIPELLPPES